MLVLQIQDLESGLETLEFFSYHNNDYIHLNVIRADAYRETLLAVDDRLSNLQKYRVAIVGRTSSDSIYMQVITLDLVKSLVDDGRANLSDLKQMCVTQLKLMEELIVIQC